ncbi:MAG: hypothetical protein ABI811_09875 [Acidobacteriota bacterium]
MPRLSLPWSPSSRWSRIQIAGWILFAASAAVLLTRNLRQPPAPPPEAESRKSAPSQHSVGAWWFTGAPAPAGEPADLTGVWFGEPIADLSKAALPGQEMVLTPFGKQRYETVDHSKNPTGQCLPPGPVRIMLMMLPMMIVQRSDIVLFLSEYQRTYRMIYTDGRGHDPDVKDYPEWMGSSVGHWEKDTLVVDTVAINDRSWLDVWGHEHSDQLHLTERFRLVDPDTLEQLATFEDPVFFVKPFTIRKVMTRQIGDRILDSACLENEKDQKNLVPTFGAEGRGR